jgi:hypothetical protein
MQTYVQTYTREMGRMEKEGAVATAEGRIAGKSQKARGKREAKERQEERGKREEMRLRTRWRGRR